MKNPIYDYHTDLATAPSAPISQTQTNSAVQYFKSTYEVENIREYLSAYPNNWPRGLQDSLLNNLHKIPYRFFICDDSGSMSMNDGQRVVQAGRAKRVISCTRWVELAESLRFHINLARTACAPVEFRFLNGSGPIIIGKGAGYDESFEYSVLSGILDGSPNGGTPLCRHIREVIATIREMESTLRSTGQKACVIIATDGESSDGNIAEAMRPLKDLPVWVVVRLCTNDEKIVDYWNRVDEELELSMDVLDDLGGEAQEVFEHNPWLVYSEPLHRLREFGSLAREYDMLDEKLLTMEDMRKMCTSIFGGDRMTSLPDPALDWAAFLRAVEALNKDMAPVFDVRTGRDNAWVDCRMLARCYGKSKLCGCNIM